MRKTAILIFILVSKQGLAQNAGQISGLLKDTAGNKGVSLATITVFTAADTSVITYRLSDGEGNFRVPGLPLNRQLRMVISSVGYAVYRKEFTLSADAPRLELGAVILQRSARQLDEVLVMAERPPVTVRNDTIEFNAASFKTLPASLVEDLLRKMPGVQIDKQGNISYNGRPVNRIMVDGKEFFGDDPKMATRNLPANVIDKVQVTDDKEQLAMIGEENANRVGKVINLKLKKGVKKGWFGKAYAGGGTGDRFEAGGIANTFRDTLQLSLLGYANNINNSGFSFQDIQRMAGFDRSGANNISIWRGNGGSKLMVNDIAFGGATDGVASSAGAGFNLNHAPNKKISLFAQYFYGHVNNSAVRENYTNQFWTDTVLASNTLTRKTSISNGHNMNAGLRLKPDSVTNINLRMGIMAGNETEDMFTQLQSLSNKTGLLSAGNTVFDNTRSSLRYNHNFSINRLSRRKKGRNFNISQSADVNRKEKDLITRSENIFYQPALLTVQQDQLRRETAPDNRLNTAFSFREPLTKKATLSLIARHEYGRLKNDIATFTQNGSGYNVPDNSRTSLFERDQHRLSFSAGLIFKIKKISITPGFTAMRQLIDNKVVTTDDVIKQRLFNLLPRFDMNAGNFSFGYSATAQAPDYEHLAPVADNSNPFFIKNGNPALKPAVNHSVNINYYQFDRRKGVNMSLYMNGSVTRNDVVQSRTIDKSGLQTTTPVNADGNRQAYSFLYISKEHKYSKKFKVTLGLNGNVNYNRSRLIVNGLSAWQQTWHLQPYFSVDFNYDDIIEFRPSLGPNYNFTRFKGNGFSPIDIKTFGANAELVVRWPRRLVWESNFSYDYNGQISGGLPKTVCLLNAAVNLQMLKEDKGNLKLSLFDALNSNNNVQRSVTANTIFNGRSNVLNRYLMLTFTYNLRKMGAGKGKVGGRERFFFID